MKRALALVGLVACAHAVAPRVAPHVMRAEVAAAAPAPAQREIDMLVRFVFAGQEPSAQHAEGTLVVVRVETKDGRERSLLEELDVATMRAVRSTDLGENEPVDLQMAGDVLYVLTTDPETDTHTIAALDRHGFGEIASSRVATAVPDRFMDRIVTTGLTIGSRGVRLTYRARCPNGTADRDDGCVFYETHRLGDLAVVKVRHYAFDRMWNASKPEIRVPDDFGELPPEPEGKPPSEATCPFHGTTLLGAATVGGHYFMLTSGCCGGPHGGFFECDVAK